jgi:hypothetical protein
MAEVKVPKLLHKMSMASQKAWYKKHGMEMPSGTEGKSAAQAKKDVGEINKKKAREAAIAAAAATSKKNKELVSSSERVRAMRKNADAWGGGLGGGLDRNRDIISYVRAGGTIKAGRLGEEALDEGNPATKEKLKNYVRGLGVKATIKGLVPFDQIHSPLRSGRKVLRTKTTAQLKKEEVEQVVAENSFTAAASMHAANRKQSGGKTAQPTHGFRVGDQVTTRDGKEGEITFVHGDTVHVKGTNDYHPDHVKHYSAKDLKKGVAEGRMKDIVTDRQETERLKAQDVLGGPVKEKPKMPPGKQPAGYRYVRGLARRAMKAGLKNEATSFPRGGGVINYNPKTEKSEKDGTAKLYDPETERMQKKLATGKMSPSQVMKKMKEEAEQVNEKLDSDAVASGKRAREVASSIVNHLNKDREEGDKLKISPRGHDNGNKEYYIHHEQDPARDGRSIFHSPHHKKFAIAGTQHADHESAVAHGIKYFNNASPKGSSEKDRIQKKKDEFKQRVEQVFEQDDTMEKKEMAQTQLHFIGYAAKEILEFIAMGGEIEEWYQNKLSKVHSDMEGLHSYIEGEKRRTGMVKEETDEKNTNEALDPVGKEDKDIDNDGDTDKTDVYLHSKRKAIGKAIRDRVAKKMGK